MIIKKISPFKGVIKNKRIAFHLNLLSLMIIKQIKLNHMMKFRNKKVKMKTHLNLAWFQRFYQKEYLKTNQQWFMNITLVIRHIKRNTFSLFTTLIMSNIFLIRVIILHIRLQQTIAFIANNQLISKKLISNLL